MNDDYLLALLIAGSILIPMLIFLITLITLVGNSRQRKLQMEQKEMQHKYETGLLQAKLEVQEKGLNQLSQEIHDNVGQVLTSLRANLIALENTGIPETGRNLVIQSKQQLSRVMKDLRNVSHVLNSKYINKIGLHDAIAKEIEYLSSNTNIKFAITADGDNDRLSPEKELMIFRIAQEALTNIVKHAQAANANIHIAYQQEGFEIDIEDDGVGLSNNKNDKGIGMINMKERAKLIEGIFEIHSDKAGTKIKVRVPYD